MRTKPTILVVGCLISAHPAHAVPGYTFAIAINKEPDRPIGDEEVTFSLPQLPAWKCRVDAPEPKKAAVLRRVICWNDILQTEVSSFVTCYPDSGYVTANFKIATPGPGGKLQKALVSLACTSTK